MDELVLVMGDTVAGSIERLRDGRLRLRYEEAYRADATATPLSIALPLDEPEHGDARITPWLWGLLPDNPAVIARWARHFQVAASSPFALLSTPVGEECAGALRLVRPERLDAALTGAGGIDWLDGDALEARLRELRQDATAWLGQGFSGRFSLAGAQAKIALVERDGRWGESRGAEPTTHILKPPIAGLEAHDLNEHLCLDAARRVGLAVASSAIVRFGDESAIAVQRYDRRRVGDRTVRIHQEDLCQALGLHPDRKYQADGGPSPAQVAALVRRALGESDAIDAVERFADALIWNWLIAGTDAHGKNHALLLAGSDVRLAPLYDLASALPYAVHERDLRFAMKIRDYRVHVEADPWPAVARELGLDPERLAGRVREMAARAPDAFADAARAEDVGALVSDLPTRLVDLVAARCARGARVVGTG